MWGVSVATASSHSAAAMVWCAWTSTVWLTPVSRIHGAMSPGMKSRRSTDIHGCIHEA